LTAVELHAFSVLLLVFKHQARENAGMDIRTRVAIDREDKSQP
jgi:hypothetical protein